MGLDAKIIVFEEDNHVTPMVLKSVVIIFKFIYKIDLVMIIALPYARRCRRRRLLTSAGHILLLLPVVSLFH